MILVVDDGSGTIACCKWHSSDPNVDRRQESYNLGQLVTVQGKISVFREQRQLTVDLICIQELYVKSISSSPVEPILKKIWLTHQAEKVWLSRDGCPYTKLYCFGLLFHNANFTMVVLHKFV